MGLTTPFCFTSSESFAIGRYKKSLVLWDLQTQEITLPPLDLGEVIGAKEISDITFLPHSPLLAFVWKDTIHFLDWSQGTLLPVTLPLSVSIHRLVTDEYTERLLAITRYELYAWSYSELATMSQQKNPRFPTPQAEANPLLRWSGPIPYFITEGHIYAESSPSINFSERTGVRIVVTELSGATLLNHEFPSVLTFTLSANGRYLAIRREDLSVEVFDVRRGSSLWTTRSACGDATDQLLVTCNGKAVGTAGPNTALQFHFRGSLWPTVFCGATRGAAYLNPDEDLIVYQDIRHGLCVASFNRD